MGDLFKSVGIFFGMETEGTGAAITLDPSNVASIIWDFNQLSRCMIILATPAMRIPPITIHYSHCQGSEP